MYNCALSVCPTSITLPSANHLLDSSKSYYVMYYIHVGMIEITRNSMRLRGSSVAVALADQLAKHEYLLAPIFSGLFQTRF